MTVNSLSASLGDGYKFGVTEEDSVVRLLVENGAEVNAVDVYDLTPLHFACMRGHDVALRDLLRYPQVNIEVIPKINYLYSFALFPQYLFIKKIVVS